MHNPTGRHRLVGGGINFHTIAGREQERLGAPGFLAQRPIDRRVADKPLPSRDVRGVVANTDAEEIHYKVCAGEKNVIPQSSVSAALKATTQRPAIQRGAVVPRWRAKRMPAKKLHTPTTRQSSRKAAAGQ
jgi:hypothetical protein